MNALSISVVFIFIWHSGGKCTAFAENTASAMSILVIRRCLPIGKGENWKELTGVHCNSLRTDYNRNVCLQRITYAGNLFVLLRSPPTPTPTPRGKKETVFFFNKPVSKQQDTNKFRRDTMEAGIYFHLFLPAYSFPPNCHCFIFELFA